MRPVRVLLADDHTLFVEGMSKLIEREFELELVGTVADGQELLTAAERLQPDVILLDISMPLLNGIDAARLLRQRGDKAKLLFVTMHSCIDYVNEAFRAGASGYVLKHAGGPEVMEAIRDVMKGNFYLTPLVKRDRLTELPWASSPQQSVSAQASGQLTFRQREVLQLIAQGHSAKTAGAVLHIAQKTVEFHKASMMRQLGLRSSAELIRYALSHEWTERIEPPPPIKPPEKRVWF
ncbi:MAG TPA: response regulator transcription factor [Pseudomonadota bacterium]|nr:response regulator transcription factor [Pseudomonadota bacterium]